MKRKKRKAELADKDALIERQAARIAFLNAQLRKQEETIEAVRKAVGSSPVFQISGGGGGGGVGTFTVNIPTGNEKVVADG